jgi:hypothetical protein
MRKPIYLAVVGISIVVAGASLGIILTRYLGLLAYSPKGAAQAASGPAVPGNPATPPTEWNNLFAPGDGMKLASRLPAMDGNSASRAPRTAYLLVGTIVSSSPAARRAILWADGMKEARAFREKEEIEPGAILTAVERDKVWISRGKEREKLEILPVGSRSRPPATARPAAASSPAAPPAVASGAHSPASSPGAPSRFVPEQPSPGGPQALGGPKASRLDADGESSASIQDRIRRLRGNRR